MEATDAIDERWSKLHAAAMLIAGLFALALGAAWPVALIGAASLSALLGLGRGRYTPAGAFGSANAVTLLRLVLITSLALIGLRLRGEVAALIMFAVFALDGLDGWLARSRQLASGFGARFDMECDALLVLVGSLLLYLRGRLPAFILAARRVALRIRAGDCLAAEPRPRATALAARALRVRDRGAEHVRESVALRTVAPAARAAGDAAARILVRALRILVAQARVERPA